MGSLLRLVMFCIAVFPLCAHALDAAEGTKTASPESTFRRLDEAISKTLNSPEYRWRLPIEYKETDEEANGPFSRFINNVRQTLDRWAASAVESAKALVERLIKWLRSEESRPSQTTHSAWSGSMRGLMLLLILIAAGATVLLMFRVWRLSRPTAESIAAAPVVTPDISKENVSAQDLPEAGWLQLATELVKKGEFRLALRAHYLASLVHLTQRGVLTVAAFKSNWDYQRELARRAHALLEVRELFAQNVLVFDRVWYGLHPADEAMVHLFAANVERIRRC